MLPNHPSQKPIFQSAFKGKGMYLTIEVENVDEVYKQLKEKGIQMEIEIQDEPWGDRHFAIKDPNGIGIDIVIIIQRPMNKVLCTTLVTVAQAIDPRKYGFI